MRNLTKVACGALALSLLECGAAWAQETPPPPPVTPGAPAGQAAEVNASKTYTLVARYRVGEIRRYRVQMTGNIEVSAANGQSPFPGGKFTVTVNLRMKTAGMKPDGTAVIAVHSEGGEVTAMGNPQPMPSVPDYFMEVDRTGRAKMRGLEGVPGADIMGKVFDMNQLPAFGSILPDHSVKVGDTWQSAVPLKNGQAMKIESTLLGAEQIGGRDTVRVAQKATMPIALTIGQDGKLTTDAANAVMAMRGSAVVNGVINIAQDNGQLVRSVANVKGATEMKLQGPAAQQSPFGDSLTMNMDEKMTMALTGTGTVPLAPVAAPAMKK